MISGTSIRSFLRKVWHRFWHLRRTPQPQRPLSKALSDPAKLALLRDLQTRDSFRLYASLLEERAYNAFQTLLAADDPRSARASLHAYLEVLYLIDSILTTGDLRRDDATRRHGSSFADDYARFFGNPLFFGARASSEFGDA